MRHAGILVAALVAVGFVACLQGTTGEQGVFVFHDLTPRPVQNWPTDLDREVDRPLAVDARLHLRVTWNGHPIRPDEVEIEPPDVIALEEVRDDGVLLRGIAPGEVRVTVRSANGREDHLWISVRRADAERVLIRPWNAYPLPESYFAGGLAILEGATSHLFGEMSLQGAPLTGHGARQFRVLPDLEEPPAVEGRPRAESDFLDLQAIRVGRTQFAFGQSVPVEVRVVTEEVIREARLLEAWRVQAGSDWICQVGDLLFPAVLPYDDENRLVTGTSQDPGPRLEIDTASSGLLEDQTPTDLSPEWKEVFQNRIGVLKCLAEGEASGTVVWRTFRLPFTVRVLPKTP